MTGSLVHRGKNRWALVLDLGYVTDAETGKKRRRQKWVTIRTTAKHAHACTADTCSDRCKARAEAEAKQHDIVAKMTKGTFVEPTKVALIEYMRDWLRKSVTPLRRPRTAHVYASMIENHIAKSAIASIPIQRLRASDLEAFYAGLKLAPTSVAICHAVLGRALKVAVRDRLILANPAPSVEHRPRPSKDPGHAAREHCWSAVEARAFLDAAKKAGPQLSAFAHLALDSGARRSELAGLLWSDVDLDTGTLTIARQLDSAGEKPKFGPTKTGRARSVSLGTETIARLRDHKRAQSELKMKNRTTYQDHGLMFAKEEADLQTPSAALGQPITSLSQAYFKRLVKAAGVKGIKFHGLRHTAATLLLAAGVPVQVVAQRLGHAQVSMTLQVYAHSLPDMQKDAAARLGSLLAGAGS